MAGGQAVTITFNAATGAAITVPRVVVNTASIDEGVGNVWQRHATIIVDAARTFLPLVSSKKGLLSRRFGAGRSSKGGQMVQTELERPQSGPAVWYAAIDTPIGLMRLASTRLGLCKVTLPNESEASFVAWLRTSFPSAQVLESTDENARAIDELQDYLAGRLTAFAVRLDMHGTDFQRAVWEAVARVPYGETRSYGEIAVETGRPAACRAVGAANGANPLPPFVPCHRIIGRNGGLTGYGGGLDLKARLLDLERTVRPRQLPLGFS